MMIINTKPTVRIVLPLLLFMSMVLPTMAQTDRVVVDGVVYTFQPFGPGGDFAVSGIDYETLPYDGVITIKDGLILEAFPGEFRPYPVTSILDNAFLDQDVLKGVIFEDGIQSIGSNAFKGCVGITSLTLPASLLRVGWGALACGDNLKWIDARNVGDQWKDEYDGYDGLGEIGVPLFTLLYMPQWCSEGGTNVVLTDPNTQERSCQDFYFDSGEDYNVPWGFTAEKIRTTRELPMDESAYTICLPYSLPVPQGAKAYSLEKKDDNEVSFKQITGDMEAFKPYLIVSHESDVQLNCEGEQRLPSTEEAVAQFDTANGVTIHGTFRRIDYNEAAIGNYYVLQEDNVWKPVGGGHSNVTVPPYRAYLTLDGTQTASFYIGFSDDTDGISSPESMSPADSSSDGWLTLDGRHLNGKPEKKGIYIHGRKKVVVDFISLKFRK